MAKKIAQREKLIALLVDHMLAQGLDKTSLRQLAEAAGTSDRMLLYYFTNKEELMTAVLTELSADLAGHLEKALPDGTRYEPAALFKKGAALITGPALQPYMRVGIEITARAGRGEEPFLRGSAVIMLGFLDWIEARLATKDARRKRTQATMILAMMDGLSVIAVGLKTSDINKAIEGFTAALEGSS